MNLLPPPALLGTLTTKTTPNPLKAHAALESNPRPSSGSGMSLSGRLTFGSGVGDPPNRQGAALFDQGNDSIDHAIAGKLVSRFGLEFAGGGRQ